jgi:hypothetical protein
VLCCTHDLWFWNFKKRPGRNDAPKKPARTVSAETVDDYNENDGLESCQTDFSNELDDDDDDDEEAEEIEEYEEVNEAARVSN